MVRNSRTRRLRRVLLADLVKRNRNACQVRRARSGTCFGRKCTDEGSHDVRGGFGANLRGALHRFFFAFVCSGSFGGLCTTTYGRLFVAFFCLRGFGFFCFGFFCFGFAARIFANACSASATDNEPASRRTASGTQLGKGVDTER
jgi:hypothetical protein